jgi:hypothetical protein
MGRSKSPFCLRLSLAAALLLAVLAPVWAGWVCVSHSLPWGNAFSFVNADTGYAVGPGVFRTFDGGVSFQNVTPLGWDWSNGSGVQFITSDTGYVGCQGQDLRRLWKTTNGGGTWLSVFSARGGWLDNCIVPICFLDAQRGYIVTGRDDSIRKTTDGGSTWSALAVPGAKCVSRVQFLDSQLGYALGHSESCGMLWRTIDGGLTWQPIWTGSGTQCMIDFQFVDGLVGYASGQRDAGRGGYYVGNVMKSSDGGMTWQELFATGADWEIDAMSFSSRDTGFVSVEDIAVDNAMLYKTENGTDFFRVRLPVGRGLFCTWPVFALKGSQVAYVECTVQKAGAGEPGDATHISCLTGVRFAVSFRYA